MAMSGESIGRWIKRTLIVVVFLLLAAVAVGPWYFFQPRDAEQGAVLHGFNTKPFHLSKEQQRSAAEKFLPYAQMSAHAYCVKNNDKDDEADQRSEKRGDIYKKLKNSGWELLTRASDAAEECPKGIYAEVWKRTSENKKNDTLVVAFRGTSGLCDWRRNLSEPIESFLRNSTVVDTLIGGFEWWNDLTMRSEESSPSPGDIDSCKNHYDEAARKVAELYQVHSGSGRELKIYTTGHSLGGGLAEYALYQNPFVEQAIGFNSSPVTNYSRISLEKKEEICRCKKDSDTGSYIVEPRVYRIYQTGEVLEKLRQLKRMLSQVACVFRKAHFFGAIDARFIHDIQFDYNDDDKKLTRSDPLSLHSIWRLAERMQGHSEHMPKVPDPWYRGPGSAEFSDHFIEICKLEDDNSACNIRGH